MKLRRKEKLMVHSKKILERQIGKVNVHILYFVLSLYAGDVLCKRSLKKLQNDMQIMAVA